MTAITSCPTWLYKQIDVPNLDTIQQELLNVAKCIINDIDTLIPNFHLVLREEIDAMLPYAKEYLDELGLLERWKYLAFITGNGGTSLPLHVDSTEWEFNAYGLNIPVLNCKNSFTVFYNATLSQSIYESTDPRSVAQFCDQDTATEIDRFEATNPCWVNICIPHRPEVLHTLPRILASFRFRPELHDVLN